MHAAISTGSTRCRFWEIQTVRNSGRKIKNLRSGALPLSTSSPLYGINSSQRIIVHQRRDTDQSDDCQKFNFLPKSIFVDHP